MCFLYCLTLGGATYRCIVYHGTAAICISIELYEIVQLRSGDGVALTLSLIVDVLCLLGRFYYIKKENCLF